MDGAEEGQPAGGHLRLLQVFLAGGALCSGRQRRVHQPQGPVDGEGLSQCCFNPLINLLHGFLHLHQ